MGLHLENEVALVKTPTVISNNPVYTYPPFIYNEKIYVSDNSYLLRDAVRLFSLRLRNGT